MVVVTTMEVHIDKEVSIMSREVITLRVESGHHHQAKEEETQDLLQTELLEPRLIIMLTRTMSENFVFFLFRIVIRN